MTVTAQPLFETKFAENTTTTQYTSTNVTTIIDKFTAANSSAAAASITVYLVPSGSSSGSSNMLTKTKNLQPGEIYTFPEITGHTLANGDFLSTVASAASAIVIRASGRVIS